MLFSFPGVYLPTLRVGGVNCIQGLTDLAANPYEVGVMISVGVTEDTGLSLSMTLHRAAGFYAPEARCVVLCCVALLVVVVKSSPCLRHHILLGSVNS
jgi:hypothetical protein